MPGSDRRRPAVEDGEPESKLPERTCVGCRRKGFAGTLVRVARRPDGSLVAGRDVPGRGAWLCRDPGTGGIALSCLDAAVRRNAFSRAFRGPVAAGSWEALRGTPEERANMEQLPDQQPNGTTQTRRHRDKTENKKD